MRTFSKLTARLANLQYQLLAVVTVGVGATLSCEAEAQTTGGIGQVANMFNTSLVSLGQTVMGVSFLGGLGFVGSGLMKLKAAADSGGRETYSPGIWRLGVGAGMVGLPAMSAILRDTATGNSGVMSIQEGTAGLVP